MLTLKKYEQQRFEILQSLAQLSSFVPGLDNYFNTKGEALLIMNTATFTPFLMQAIPAIQFYSVFEDGYTDELKSELDGRIC